MPDEALAPAPSTAATSAVGAPSSSHGGRDRLRGTVVPAVIVALVVVVGAAGLFVWDAWFVNHDGTFYMALAHNLRRGAGYTFPDGTAATFRGPGYSGLLAAGWLLFADTARSAIWVSRVAGLLAPVAMALLLWRWTRAWLVALAIGCVAALQPWALISGGIFFAPDGLAAGLAVLAVLVAFWSPGSLPQDRNLRSAGLLLGAAFVVKDPFMLVVLVPIGVVVAHRDGGLRSAARSAGLLGQGWLVLAAPWLLYALVAGGELPPVLGNLDGAAAWLLLAGIVAVPFLLVRLSGRGGPVLSFWVVAVTVFGVALGAYVFAAGANLAGFGELWSSVGADLVAQLYGDSPWAWLIPGVVIGVAWVVARHQQLAVQAAALLTLVGLAGLIFASLTGAGLRNGLLLAYGLLLLLGLAAAGLASRGRWVVAVSVVLVAGVAYASIQASAATNDRLPIDSLTAESPATVAAAEWLRAEAAGDAVVGTPLFTQSLWRLADGESEWGLLANHEMDASAWADGDRTFERRVDWAGTTPVPATRDSGLAYTLNRSRTGAYLPETVFAALPGSGYLVLTGNAGFPGSAFDAGGLLPVFEATSGLTPVWRSPVASDQWVVIYRIEEPSLLGPSAPVVHRAGDALIPSIDPNQVVLSSAEYEAMVREVLGRPIGR